MDFEPEEKQIVELLSKLKEHGGAYPKDMLASRREIFLSQMASVGAGLGIGAGLKTVTKATKTTNIFSAFSAGSLIETILVVVIVAQAGVIAYNYRDKILDFLNSLTASATPTEISIPVTGASVTEVIATDTPLATDTLTETLTVTAEPTDTTESVDNSSGNTTVQNTPAAVTPQPTTKDNPGQHLGQTPKPPQPKNDPKATKSTDNGGNNKKP